MLYEANIRCQPGVPGWYTAASHCTPSNDIVILKKELQTVWNEVFVACLEEQCLNFPGVTKESKQIIQSV